MFLLQLIQVREATERWMLRFTSIYDLTVNLSGKAPAQHTRQCILSLQYAPHLALTCQCVHGLRHVHHVLSC